MNFKRINKKELNINLKKNEQVTFKFLKKSEFDFVSKEWGAYVTPSIFRRCKKFKLTAALIKELKTNNVNLVFVRLGKENLFLNYLKNKEYLIITWLKPKHLKKNI